MKKYVAPSVEIVKTDVASTFATYPSGCDVTLGLKIVGTPQCDDLLEPYNGMGWQCIAEPHEGYDW